MGRPPKVRPPPRAWKASGTIPDLLQAEHLETLPQNKRRLYLPGTDLPAAAAELNRTFESYALWAAGEHNRATRSELRDWFKQVSGQAANILHALGHDRAAPSGASFEDVLLHLIVTRPNPGSVTGAPGEEWYAQHKLECLTRLGAPEAYALTKQQGASFPAWEIAQESIGARLHATLALLQLLSDRGAKYYAARVAKGGQSEKARKHLIANLAGQYERLFGRLPGAPSFTRTKAEEAAGERRESLPKGHALEWFRALLDLIDTRAKEALPACQPGGVAPNPERGNLLHELVDLAGTARKGKAADGLAHWIRDGAAAWARRPPPNIIVPAPDFRPTPLEKLFE